jgi:hypothetical protein
VRPCGPSHSTSRHRYASYATTRESCGRCTFTLAHRGVGSATCSTWDQCKNCSYMGVFFHWQMMVCNQPFAQKWVPDEQRSTCTQCCKGFSVTVRRRHCRSCGDLFCRACWYGIFLRCLPVFSSVIASSPRTRKEMQYVMQYSSSLSLAVVLAVLGHWTLTSCTSGPDHGERRAAQKTSSMSAYGASAC